MQSDFDTEIEVWECNELAWTVFTSMGTQWNAGMGGATGLNYSAMPMLFDLLGVEKERQLEIFRDIQVMEYAALDQMAENREDG